MDYFLRRDARCYKLINDSTEMAGEINSLKIQKAEFKANEQDLNAQASTNKLLANNYKADLVNMQIKYVETQGKAKFRGKVAIGSVVVNIGLASLLIVLLK